MDDNTFKYDILNELFNIGVGKAASLLSDIIERKILLSVPKIEILNISREGLKISEHLPKVLDGALMVSSICFEEKLSGKANLIFPAEKMRKFINLCVHNTDEAERDYIDMDFTDVDFDVIKEIGNIILNCIIGEIGNNLDMSLKYTLPEVQVFDKINLDKDMNDGEYNSVIILYITFSIDNTEIEGAILVNLTLNSLNELMKILGSVEVELNG